MDFATYVFHLPSTLDYNLDPRSYVSPRLLSEYLHISPDFKSYISVTGTRSFKGPNRSTTAQTFGTRGRFFVGTSSKWPKGCAGPAERPKRSPGIAKALRPRDSGRKGKTSRKAHRRDPEMSIQLQHPKKGTKRGLRWGVDGC